MDEEKILRHYICSICSIEGLSEKELDTPIPTFYSEKHAKDQGWLKTSSVKFCPPDKNFVWICQNVLRGI